ncbi:MAG: hypothetical protein ACXWVS_01070 [Hyphomicrobium sp.]
MRHGAACVASCWFAMAAMSLHDHSMAGAIAVAVVLFAERNEMRPQVRASQLILLLLAVSALLPG